MREYVFFLQRLVNLHSNYEIHNVSKVLIPFIDKDKGLALVPTVRLTSLSLSGLMNFMENEKNSKHCCKNILNLFKLLVALNDTDLACVLLLGLFLI